jgi:uracil-DNA glycosylase
MSKKDIADTENKVPNILTNIWNNWKAPDGKGPCGECPAHWSRREDLNDESKQTKHSYGMDPWYGDGSVDADIAIVGREPGPKNPDESDNRIELDFDRSPDITEVAKDSASIEELAPLFEAFSESGLELYWTEMKKCNKINGDGSGNADAEDICCGLGEGRSYLAEELSAIDPDYVVPLGKPATEKILELYDWTGGWENNFSEDVCSGSSRSGFNCLSQHSAPFEIIPAAHPDQRSYNSHWPEKIRNIEHEYSSRGNYYYQFAIDLLEKIGE